MSPKLVAELEQRLEYGTPFRLGELARFVGFTREYLRQLADAGVLKTIEPHRPHAHRRVDAGEAERFARSRGVLS